MALAGGQGAKLVTVTAPVGWVLATVAVWLCSEIVSTRWQGTGHDRIDQ